MTTLIINSGSGPVENTDLKHAIENIEKFVQDCKEKSGFDDIRYRRAKNLDNEGRYGFIVYLSKAKHEIEMPGLPIAKVRYMKDVGQNIWNFPRLYVDGSSWVWFFAILGRKENWIPDENGQVES